MEKKMDLRIQKTYRALSETFLEMLSEKKFEEITVNELCERAMVRRATFYKHFADKYDFFGFFIRQLQEEFEEKSREGCAPQEPSEYFQGLLKQMIEFMKTHQKIVDFVLRSDLFPNLLHIISEEIYRETLLELKEKIYFHKKLPMSPELLAAFYTGGLVQSLRHWILSGDKEIAEEAFIEEIGMILKSFQHGVWNYVG